MHAVEQSKKYGRPLTPKIQRTSKGTEFLKMIHCLAPKWNYKQLSNSASQIFVFSCALVSLQPRSQGLSSLSPLVVGTETLGTRLVLLVLFTSDIDVRPTNAVRFQASLHHFIFEFLAVWRRISSHGEILISFCRTKTFRFFSLLPFA